MMALSIIYHPHRDLMSTMLLPETIAYIFSFLDVEDILNCIPYVCKKWRDLTKRDHSPCVWTFFESIGRDGPMNGPSIDS